MEMRFKCDKTKKGYPAMWEEGGGMTSQGHAKIIAGPQGQPKMAVFVKSGGHLACSSHALFIVNPGDLIIKVGRYRSEYEINVSRITRFEERKPDELYSYAQVINTYTEGEWDNEEDVENYKDAVDAGIRKANCYHCREMHYGEYPRRDVV